MTVYTYIDNKDSHDHTARIVLRGGGLVLLKGNYADLTDAEIAYLEQDRIMIEGAVGTPAGAPHKGSISFFDLADTPSTLALNQTVVGDGSGGLFAKTVPDGGGGGGGTSVSAVPGGAAPVRYFIMGDSASQNAGTAWDPDNPSNGGIQSANSFAAYVTFWSRGRAVLARNAGISGNTSGALLARLQTDVLDVVTANPDRYDVLVEELTGGNDFGSWDTATTIANLQAIYDRLATLNKPVVIFTMYIRDAGAAPGGSAGVLPSYAGGNYTAADYFARVAAINDFVKDYARGKPLFTVCDIHSVLVDPIAGTYRAGYSNDGTHTKGPGSSAVGRLLAQVLEPYMGQDTGLAASRNEDSLVTPDYFFSGSASNDIQLVKMSGAPTTGTQTWTITADDAALYGVPAGSITVAWNAPATPTIQAAMDAIWGAGNTAVTGNGPDGSGNWSHYVTWQGAYAGKTMPLLQVTNTFDQGSLLVDRSAAGGGQVGGVAAGWAVSGAGLKCSVEPRADGLGNWQVIEVLAGNDVAITLSHLIASGAIAVNDVVYGEAEVVTEDDWVDPSNDEFTVQMLGSIGTRVLTCMQATGISPNPGAHNPGPAQGVKRTTLAKSDQLVTFGSVALGWTLDAGSRVKVGRCGVRRYT